MTNVYHTVILWNRSTQIQKTRTPGCVCVLQSPFAQPSRGCTAPHILIQFPLPQTTKASTSLCFTDLYHRRHNTVCYSFLYPKQYYRKVQSQKKFPKPHGFSKFDKKCIVLPNCIETNHMHLFSTATSFNNW